MQNLASIISALPSLSKRELNALRAELDRLLGAPAATPSPLYSHLLTITGTAIPYSRFQQSTAYKDWELAEKEFIRFVDATWPGVNKVTKNALMLYLFSLIQDYLKSLQLPVTPKTVSQNMFNIKDIFDINFPGYLQTGLANLVLKAMVGR